MNTRKIGDFYEREAVRYLEKQGYRIEQRNFRCRCGEIDYIAIAPDHETLVYGEIKYRSTGCCGNGLEAVDYRKQRRISRAALVHYQNHGMDKGRKVRFDVIAIDGKGRIQLVQNAFDFVE